MVNRGSIELQASLSRATVPCTTISGWSRKSALSDEIDYTSKSKCRRVASFDKQRQDDIEIHDHSSADQIIAPDRVSKEKWRTDKNAHGHPR